MTYFPDDDPVPATVAQPDMFGTPDVGGDRDATDRYYTPSWATSLLVAYMGEARLVGPIWEPCAGQCHIAHVLRDSGFQVIATDIHPHDSLDGVCDFLDRSDGGDWLNAPFPWIISNPPYTLPDGTTAASFVKRALEVAELGVAMLLRVPWLEPCRDRIDIFQKQPPTDYLFIPRINFLGATKNGSNPAASAWYIWDKRDRQLMHEHEARVRHYSPADCYRYGLRPRK